MTIKSRISEAIKFIYLSIRRAGVWQWSKKTTNSIKRKENVGPRSAYIDLPLLCDVRPVLSSDACPPIEFERHCNWRLVVGGPEASQVVSGLRWREREITRLNNVGVVDVVSVRWGHLENPDQTTIPSIEARVRVLGLGKSVPSPLTLTLTLWETGSGALSLGLTTEYLPTAMAFILISSEMHFVEPDCRSNRRDDESETSRKVERRRRRSLDSTIFDQWIENLSLMAQKLDIRFDSYRDDKDDRGREEQQSW